MNSDCGDCLVSPRQFNFEFIDADTSENLFVNETFNKDNLTVFDENDTEVKFTIALYNERYILSLNSIGWELEPKIYTVALSDDVSIIFKLDMDKIEDDCCTYYEVKAFKLENFEYDVTQALGIIKVKI